MDRVRIIEVKEDILADNEAMAAELRARLKEKKILINLMASPGAGKTTLLLKNRSKASTGCTQGQSKGQDSPPFPDAQKKGWMPGWTFFNLSA